MGKTIIFLLLFMKMWYNKMKGSDSMDTSYNSIEYPLSHLDILTN